ncbi:MAG: hypothetical protein IH892_16745 [Planctomycetes bacterium]|nr:hypothetical protein [Planctomycetota bacterium]
MIFAKITIETRPRGPRWWGKGESIYVTAIPLTDKTELGTIRNVTFSNILCRGESGVFIHGWQGGHVEDVTFENVQIQIDKWTEWPGGFYDTGPGIGAGVYASLIAGIHCRHARDLAFRHCRVVWGKNRQS